MQSPMVEGMLKTSNVPPQYIGERGQYKMNTNLELKLTYILFRIVFQSWDKFARSNLGSPQVLWIPTSE